MKESNPIETAEYAKLRGIGDEAAFAWWADYTLKKRDHIISAVNSKLRNKNHKYGVELPYADAQLVQAKVPEDVSHDLSVRSNLDGTFALRARFTKSGRYNIQVFAKSEEEDPFEQQSRELRLPSP